MIELEEAQKIILENINKLEEEEVNLLSSHNRTLNEDIYADLDIPSYDASAMDGYALIASDTKGALVDKPVTLEIVENIPAGYIPLKEINSGYASCIMTGGMIPKGADSVIMVENSEKFQNEKQGKEKIMIFKEVKKGEHIRRSGEDVKKGNMILSKGSKIRAAEIGMLASLGYTKVKVVRKPIVAIMATGDELVEPGDKLSPGKIRNSNTYSLASQIRQAGGIPLNLGIIKDDKSALKEAVKRALSADLILSSAGVSIGKYDLVKNVFEEMGLRLLFWKVATKPGKPTVFGIIQGKPYIGLPGYPVSSMVCFELYARAAILKMMGRKELFRSKIKVTVIEDIKNKSDRTSFLRAVIKYNIELNRYEAKLTGPQQSGILSSMVLANGLLIIPKDVNFIKSGSLLEAMLLEK